MAHGRPWTPEEDATLAARGREASDALTDRLGRSRASVEKLANGGLGVCAAENIAAAQHACTLPETRFSA